MNTYSGATHSMGSNFCVIGHSNRPRDYTHYTLCHGHKFNYMDKTYNSKRSMDIFVVVVVVVALGIGGIEAI